MNRNRHSISLAVATCAALLLMVSAVSAAPPEPLEVNGPFFDATTGGDWRDNYGSCFFLLPDSRNDITRESVGPNWCTTDATEYRYNNCYGGPLFDLAPENSSVDWRIFSNDSESVAIATWSTSLPIMEDSGQWNPCINDFRHSTYATNGDSLESLSLDLKLDVEGDITIAYYFTGAMVRCRGTDFSLLIDGVEMSSGTVEDFASGTYVVFDVQGLKRTANGTTISIKAEDAAGAPSCDVSELESTNVHLSGVFVSGMNTLQANSCRSLVVNQRGRSSRGHANDN